jgi:hypothetical protein
MKILASKAMGEKMRQDEKNNKRSNSHQQKGKLNE